MHGAVLTCGFSFNLEVSEETIRTRCSGAIEILLDDPSDHTKNVSGSGGLYNQEGEGGGFK